MNHYFAFGLYVASEFPLPDLTPAEPGGEITAGVVYFRRATVAPTSRAPAELGADGWFEVLDPTHTLYSYPGIARFAVNEGREVRVDAEPAADESLVRHILLGPVFATLLWQRGLCTLHACVLNVKGVGVAFMGPSGEGKSTLATILVERGHRLASDDVAAIPWREKPILAIPSFPRMKVYGAVLEQVGKNPDELPKVHAGIDKRAVMSRTFSHEPVPLSRLFVLGAGDREECVQVPPTQALLLLMSQAYRPRQFVAHVGRAQLMQMCARIVEQTRVFVLKRPRDLTRLETLARFIEAELERA